MQRAKRVLAIATFTLITSCTPQMIPAATPPTALVPLRLYATSATLPLMHELASVYGRTHSAVVFDALEGNYESIVERLMLMETPYFNSNHLPADSPLWAAPIAQDGIAVVVNPQNTVNGLTVEQLRDIYQGHITHWSEVGG